MRTPLALPSFSFSEPFSLPVPLSRSFFSLRSLLLPRYVPSTRSTTARTPQLRVDPFRPLVSLHSSSFSNSPRWHQRPLCSFLDAEKRLNANHQPPRFVAFLSSRRGLICRNGMTHCDAPKKKKGTFTSLISRSIF